MRFVVENRFTCNLTLYIMSWSSSGARTLHVGGNSETTLPRPSHPDTASTRLLLTSSSCTRCIIHFCAEAAWLGLDLGLNAGTSKTKVHFSVKLIYYFGIGRFALWGNGNPNKSFFLNLLWCLLDLQRWIFFPPSAVTELLNCRLNRDQGLELLRITGWGVPDSRHLIPWII